MLRLIHKESNNRVLLKGFVGAILDVSFAHAGSNLLACVDQGGNLQIWDLDRAKDVSEIPTYPYTFELHHSNMLYLVSPKSKLDKNA